MIRLTTSLYPEKNLLPSRGGGKFDEHTAKLKKEVLRKALCGDRLAVQKSLTPGIFIEVTGEGFWQRFQNPCHLYALRAA